MHQLAIYTAISQLLLKAKTPTHVDIRLAVNVPITTYKDSVQKRQFKYLIENQQRINHLTVNNKVFSFDLSNITIAFEGMGDIYNRSESFKDRNTIIVDLGGLNTTLCTFTIHRYNDSF